MTRCSRGPVRVTWVTARASTPRSFGCSVMTAKTRERNARMVVAGRARGPTTTALTLQDTADSRAEMGGHLPSRRPGHASHRRRRPHRHTCATIPHGLEFICRDAFPPRRAAETSSIGCRTRTISAFTAIPTRRDFRQGILHEPTTHSEAPVPVAHLIDNDIYLGFDPSITLDTEVDGKPAAAPVGIAEFTNANFFSEDTVRNLVPPSPVAIPARWSGHRVTAPAGVLAPLL